MKILFFALAFFLFFSTSVFAALSVEDLEKIRQIVNESEARLETRFTAEIRAQGDRITEQGKRLDFHGTLLVALIVTIITFVGVPLGIITYQYNRYRDRQDEEMRVLREKQDEEMRALREKIEELERKQIITT